jgi:hypothetical protein
MPTVADIAALLAALEKYPVGALLLLLFVLAAILGLWVYKHKPPSRSTAERMRKLAIPEQRQ